MDAQILPGSDVVVVLRAFQAFIDAMLNNGKHQADGLFGGLSTRSFSRKLAALNGDPGVEGTFPFMLFNPEEVALDEDEVDSIHQAFVRAGLDGEIMIIREGDWPLVFFSHGARSFVDHLCSAGGGLAYTNLLGNGLVCRQIAFVGLYSAPVERLRRYSKQIGELLKKIVN